MQRNLDELKNPHEIVVEIAREYWFVMGDPVPKLSYHVEVVVTPVPELSCGHSCRGWEERESDDPRYARHVAANISCENTVT